MSDAQPHKRQPWLRRWGAYATLPWLVVLWRVLIGGVFLFAGFSKVILPHAEVVAHIQQYQVVPTWLIPLAATVLPWVEVASGTALLVGWYTTWAAGVIAAQLVSFIGLMVVVLAAGIPIEDCGCFGNLGLPETPLQVLIRDLMMLALLGPIVYRQRDVFGLDTLNDVSTSSAPPTRSM